MTARKKLTRDERHAAALLMITRGDGKPVVTREEAKQLTALEIIETFAERTHIEHIVPHALTQNNHPSNIQFLAPDEHAPKTKTDVTAIAKTKRVAKKHEEFRRKLLAKSSDEPDVEIVATRPKSRLRGRGFANLPPGTKKDWKTGKLKKVGTR